jgi:hypothetical protein
MILFLFSVLTFILGVKSMFTGGFYLGFAMLVGPALCVWAGSGLKGSIIGGLRDRQFTQVLVGLIGAVLFVGGGILLAWHSGFWVGLFGLTISGPYWCLIGLAIGWFSTQSQHVPAPASTPASEL